MKLDWREQHVAGVPFSTSLTEDEQHWLTEHANDKHVLDIGTAYGFSACLMGQVAKSVLTVDPHNGYGSMGGSLNMATSNIRRMRKGGPILPVVGHSASVMAWLLNQGVRFDLVFIDGDHRYDGVTSDLWYGQRLLSANGRLAVHDYGEDSCPDVARAANMLGAPDAIIDSLWITTW